MPTPATIITVSLNPAVDRILSVEGFAAGAHQVGREISRMPAGKALNVSRVMSNLGVPTVATGFLGKENRQLFDDLFHGSRIVDQFFPLPGRTRENITIADPRTGHETHIRDAGLEIQPRYFDRLRKKLHLLCRSDRIIIFSGSLPPGVAPEDFAALLRECIGTGARVVVDTSGPALKAIACEKLWLMKPNAIELGQLVERDLKTLDEQLAAAAEVTLHVQTVLFSRGAEGAYLLTGDQVLHAVSPVDPSLVRNTVGCGDVLLGAFVAAVWAGQGHPQALGQAVACATASACCLGTADFDPAFMRELQAKVQVEELRK